MIDVLLEMLQDESDAVESKASLFILDLILQAPKLGSLLEFKKHYYHSKLIQQLEILANDVSFFKRCDAVHTLGRTGSKSSLSKLKEIFNESKEKDPLFLGDLAFEINWLSGGNNLSWYKSNLLNLDSFLSRWACLDVFKNISVEPVDKDWKLKYDIILQFCGDSNIKVSTEALFLKDEMEFISSLDKMGNKTEKRQQRKELEKRRPLCFEEIKVKFISNMHNANKSVYTIDELHEFVKKNDS